MLWDSWWPVLLDQLEIDNNVLLWYKSGNCLINCSMPTFLGARICLGSMGEMLVLQGDVMPVQNPCWLAWSWKVGMKDLPKICHLSVCSSALHQQLCSCGGFYSHLSVQSKPAVICTLRIPLGFTVPSDRTFWDCLLKLHLRCSLSHLCGDQKGFLCVLGSQSVRDMTDGHSSDSSSWSGEKAGL